MTQPWLICNHHHPSIQARIFKCIMRNTVYAFYRFHPNDYKLRRKYLDKGAQEIITVPKECTVERVSVSGVSCEWISTTGADPSRVVMYLHGGAYVSGSLAIAREGGITFSRGTGVPVLAVDYRLAPEYPFPAALEDAVTAYHWLLDRGFAPEHIVLVGDSAGGGLALALALWLRDHGDPLPAGVAALSPWTDLTARGDSYETKARVDPCISVPILLRDGQHYVGNHHADEPYISPLYGNLKGLAPIFIEVGTDEVLLDDSLAFCLRAYEAGVWVRCRMWREMFHVFPLYGRFVPEGRFAAAELGAVMHSWLYGKMPAL